MDEVVLGCRDVAQPASGTEVADAVSDGLRDDAGAKDEIDAVVVVPSTIATTEDFAALTTTPDTVAAGPPAEIVRVPITIRPGVAC